MDLLSLLLTLRPLSAPPADRPLPLWWGRAAHALLLDVVRQRDSVLAAALHENTQAEQAAGENLVRPFTVSTLIGRAGDGGPLQQEQYTLRLTAFRADVADCLAGAAREGALTAGAVVELDYFPFRVEAVQPGDLTPKTDLTPQPPSLQGKGEKEGGRGSGSPWEGCETYQTLSAPYLLAKNSAGRRIGLDFRSPTTFKSGGKHVPLPLPGLVFGSLLERWNACAPIAFPHELRRYAEECLALTQYKLSTRPVPAKSGSLRVGFVGEVSYTSLNYDRYWMSLLGVLAEFALYAGVGAGTSMGMGQCRLSDEG